MRIISGSDKGRKLHKPASGDKSIRPTADRAREALFSILGARIHGSRVLDLFAGTGAIGCEALSRGAEEVVFVDQSKTSLELVRKNCSLISDGLRRATILKKNLRTGILRELNSTVRGEHFDLIFADPPYQKGFSENILVSIDRDLALSDKGLVIIEEKKNIELPGDLNNLIFSESRQYGDTVFHFYLSKVKSYP